MQKNKDQSFMSFAEIVSEMKTTGSDWVLANHNVVGFYRVNYDQSNWDKLLQHLNTNHEVSFTDALSHHDIMTLYRYY